MLNSLRLQFPGTIIAALVLFAGMTVLTSCGQPGISVGEENRSTSAGGPTAEVLLEVPTIFCTGCQPRVEASINSVPGVREVRFNEERMQRVAVIYNPSRTTPKAIIQAVEKGGDKVTEVIPGGEQ